MLSGRHTPGLAALGTGCYLFGLIVITFVWIQYSCFEKRGLLNATKYCSLNLTSSVFLVAGCAQAFVAGWMSWSRSRPGIGIAGSLGSLAAWSVVRALDSWWRVTGVESGAEEVLDENITENQLVCQGIFWAIIACVLVAAAACTATSHYQNSTRKEPWAIVAVLGLYFLIQAVGSFWHASTVGICRSSILVTANRFHCVGFVIGGVGEGLGFIFLVCAAAISTNCSMRRPAAAPILT